MDEPHECVLECVIIELKERAWTYKEFLQMCGFTEKAQTELEQHYHDHFDFIRNVDVHLECSDAITPIGFGFSVDVAGYICAIQEHSGDVLSASKKWIRSI